MSYNAFYPIATISFLCGLIGGFAMHRSDFCMAGAFRDLFLFRQAFMLRILALATVACMGLYEIARLTGFLLYPFPRFGFPSLANVIGGFLFGIGMVLAGGCVVGILYKMGAGSLLSALSFVGLVIGSAFYAEVHPWWIRFARSTTVAKGMVTLPQLLHLSPTIVVVAVLAPIGFIFRRWWRQGVWQRRSPATGYLQPWKAALLLSLLGLASAVFIGMPLAITTAYTKMGAWIENSLFPDHFAGLAYFKAMPLDYIAPLGNTRLTGGPGYSIDAYAVTQYPLVAGIVAGGMLSALLAGEFKVHLSVPVRQCCFAFAGGIVMGLASRMAPACNLWHFLGGLPILALPSMLFLLGLIPGAWAGSRILVKWVLNG